MKYMGRATIGSFDAPGALWFSNVLTQALVSRKNARNFCGQVTHDVHISAAGVSQMYCAVFADDVNGGGAWDDGESAVSLLATGSLTEMKLTIQLRQ